MSLELVSFVICPFVQRAVITLREKGVSFEVTYIDVEHPPEWFKTISPFGKVPLLKVDSEVLFESAIINEYLDEVYPPALHPSDPMTRAKHRGWIEYGSNLLFEQAKLIIAKDEDAYEQQKESLGGSFARLAGEVSNGPYFAGGDFSLIDAAYAPLFMRFEMLKRKRPDLEDILPSKLLKWSDSLLGRESVKTSVTDDFEEQFFTFFKAKGSYLLDNEQE
ncbi:MAG: glutathione S-transferase family protein [Candidatus Sedimenticola sp. 20ELBAFRAG]